MDPVTVSSILSNVGLVFTQCIGWAVDVGETIVANPLLLVFTLTPLCGIGIGIFRRLINVN